jgi:hypothetical protein
VPHKWGCLLQEKTFRSDPGQIHCGNLVYIPLKKSSNLSNYFHRESKHERITKAYTCRILISTDEYARNLKTTSKPFKSKSSLYYTLGLACAATFTRRERVEPRLGPCSPPPESRLSEVAGFAAVSMLKMKEQRNLRCDSLQRR